MADDTSQKKHKPTKAAVFAEMLTALRVAEAAMSNNPQFNAWDLGPSPILVVVRNAIALAEGRP